MLCGIVPPGHVPCLQSSGVGAGARGPGSRPGAPVQAEETGQPSRDAPVAFAPLPQRRALVPRSQQNATAQSPGRSGEADRRQPDASAERWVSMAV